MHCFASGADDGSLERQTVKHDCDTFLDVSELSAEKTAAAINDQRVDVLLDYDGMHEFNNQVVLGLHPAAVQVSVQCSIFLAGFLYFNCIAHERGCTNHHRSSL